HSEDEIGQVNVTPQLPEISRHELRVGVEVKHKGSRRQFDRAPHRRAVTAVVFVPKDTHPRVRSCDLFKNLCGSIRRAIVHHHDLRRVQTVGNLAANVSDDRLDDRGLVVGGHHDRYEDGHSVQSSSGWPRVTRRATSIPIFTAWSMLPISYFHDPNRPRE